MSEPSAYVYRERGRETIRMELSVTEYEQMLEALTWGPGGKPFADLLYASRQPKHDRSEIFERFTDAPPIG